MKFRQLLAALMALFSYATAQTASAQQLSAKQPHRRYKLIDLGTFGGTASTILFQPNIVNSHGDFVGWAETDIPDPYVPCANLSCQVAHAFKWHDGEMTDLGALPGLNSSGIPGVSPAGIDERGVVIGSSQNGLSDPFVGPAFEAVTWKNGRIMSLGSLGGNFSVALDLNEDDEVIGGATNRLEDPWFGFGTQMHAFLWRLGVMHDLGTLGGPDSIATDINHYGQIAGSSLTNSTPDPTTGFPTIHPFLWENGHMIDLGSLGGTGTFDDFFPLLNDRRQVTGQSHLPGNVEQHAFLWERGRMKDLGTLGGTFSRPSGISGSGSISGGATTFNETVHAVLWRGGVLRDLAPGDDCSIAWGLNAMDQVVGIRLPACDWSQAYAFLWENGSMVDLNTRIPASSGLHLVYAQAITGSGEIVGIGVPPGVAPIDVEDLGHAYVLIPLNTDNDASSDRADFTQNSSPQAQEATLSSLALTARAKAATARLIAHVRARAVHRSGRFGITRGAPN